MLENLCEDCGMMLPADTKVCTGCGFDNQKDQNVEISSIGEYFKNSPDRVAPENFPGY